MSNSNRGGIGSQYSAAGQEETPKAQGHGVEDDQRGGLLTHKSPVAHQVCLRSLFLSLMQGLFIFRAKYTHADYCSNKGEKNPRAYESFLRTVTGDTRLDLWSTLTYNGSTLSDLRQTVPLNDRREEEEESAIRKRDERGLHLAQSALEALRKIHDRRPESNEDLGYFFAIHRANQPLELRPIEQSDPSMMHQYLASQFLGQRTQADAALRAEAQAMGFLLEDAPPDGSCQFHSLTRAYARETGILRSVQELRRASVRQIREGRLAEWAELQDHYVQEAANFAGHVEPPVSVDDYLDGMAAGRFWGDEATLRAALLYLDARVLLYNADDLRLSLANRVAASPSSLEPAMPHC